MAYINGKDFYSSWNGDPNGTSTQNPAPPTGQANWFADGDGYTRRKNYSVDYGEVRVSFFPAGGYYFPSQRPFGFKNIYTSEGLKDYYMYSYVLAYPNGKKPTWGSYAYELGDYYGPDTYDKTFKDSIYAGESLVYEVPGKVVMERITNVDSKVMAGKKQCVIDFEWIIESRIPPSRVLTGSNSSSNPPGADELGGVLTGRFWYTDIDNRKLYRFTNAKITNIYVSIRKLAGTATSSGGITVTDPFDTQYEEVAYVTIPAGLITDGRGPGDPFNPDKDYLPLWELNDTNKGQNTRSNPSSYYPKWRRTVGWRGQVESFPTSEPETWIDMKGYGRVKIRVTTDGTAKLLSADQKTEVANLDLTWVGSNTQFENTHYYMTVQPRNHPIDRLKSVKQDANFRADMNIPSDGYLPVEKYWPLDYLSVSQLGDNYVNDAVSWQLNGLSRGFQFKINKRFKPGDPKDGGWTRNSGTKNWMDKTLKKLEDGSSLFSINDREVDNKFAGGGISDFRLYGFVVKSYFESVPNALDTEKATKQDLIDQNVEHFAWFKTSGLIIQPSGTPTWNHANDAIQKPFVNYVSAAQLTNSSDNTTYTAKVFGRFIFKPNSKLSSDKKLYSIDAYLETDFSSTSQGGYFSQDYTIWPTSMDLIRNAYFHQKDGVYYGKLKRPKDLPVSCGFRYRKMGTSTWRTTTVKTNLNNDLSAINLYLDAFRPKFVTDDLQVVNYSDTKANGLTFESDLVDSSGGIIKIPVSERYEYQIWVKNGYGETFYAEPQQTDLTAGTYPIGLNDISLPAFPSPQANVNGYWYQIFDSWLRPSDTNPANQFFLPPGSPLPADTSRQFSPYLTVRPLAPTGQQSQFPYNKFNGLFPVHYYMNFEFSGSKHYQIRTIVTDFYGGTLPDGTPFSTKRTPNVLILTTPWSEEVQYNEMNITLPATLDINGNSKLGHTKNINLYLTTNINAFANKKTNPNKPINSIRSTTNPQNPITYSSYPSFNRSSLAYFEIFESDWILQGQGVWNVMNQTSKGKVYPIGTQLVPDFDINGQPVGGKGWHFIVSQKKLTWFDTVPPSTAPGSMIASYKDTINTNLPMGGDVNDFFSAKQHALPYYLINNFAAKFIPYQTFNVTFTYENNSNFEMTMYTGGQLPYRVSESDWWKTDIDLLIKKGYVKKVANLTTLGVGRHECKFVGLIGNQYLFFVATPIIKFYDSEMNKVDQNFDSNFKYLFNTNLTSGYQLSNGANGLGTYSVVSLYDFKFSGSYHTDNNKIFDTRDPDYKLNQIEGVTYSQLVGFGNNVVPGSPNMTTVTSAKVGTGTFNSGVWENGVWNNGWRDDHTFREFFGIENFYLYEYNSKCKIRINGPKKSVSYFKVGDQVSISNIVAIDINEERKLLKNFYTISEKSERWIEVDLSVEFSLMRVEVDSDEHRILVSRNVWLNGVFFNGYFRGIWNDGLFSGYPMITKMERAHWIDGTFNGGHFVAKKLKFDVAQFKQGEFQNYPRLSVVTIDENDLQVGDIVSILYLTDKEQATFGTTKILKVLDDNKTFVTSVPWTSDISEIVTLLNIYLNQNVIPYRPATVLTIISDGLIQNFQFYSNNVSTVTSIESLLSQRVFSYNSWIDVNYSNQSGVNIGRPENYNDPTSGRPYSENNLFGYPTNDVLSSRSIFRDSFSLSFREYKLGKRYKIVSDFIGQASTFEDFFNKTDTDAGPGLFNQQGWDFDITNSSTVNIISITQSESDTTPSYVSLYVEKDGAAERIKKDDVLSLQGPFTVVTGKVPTDDPKITVKQRTATFTVTGVITGEKSNQIVTSLTQSRPIFNPNGFVCIDTGTGYWDINSQGIPFIINLPTQNNIVFSRTDEPNNPDSKLRGKELRIETSDKGGVLNVIPTDDVVGRINTEANATISKRRYSMVEFDVVQVEYATASNTTYYEDDILGKLPPIHFNNLNVVTRERIYSGVKTVEKKIASYLPIYKNVNHVSTIGRKKQEFFFNKRNLLMNFTGTGQYGFIKTDFYIDNLKLYETDMVPFFQYFNNPYLGIGGNINNSVQIPYSTLILGPSPEIEDSDNDNSKNSSVQDNYGSLLIPLIEIPESINWERDYVIYRTQDIDYDQIAGIYDVNTITILRNLQANLTGTNQNSTSGNTSVDVKDKGSLTVPTTSSVPDPNSPGLNPNTGQNNQTT